MTRNATVAIAGAVAVLVAVGVLTGGVGAAPSESSVDHGADNGNYTVSLPFATDHYPRDANPGGPYNASINHLAASTPELLAKKGADRGIEQVGFIIISNQDIDFSQCATENTGAFGVDRDNDDAGTVTDIGLLQYRENSKFRNHAIVVDFYEGDELAAGSQPDKGGPGENPEQQGQGREDGDKNAEVYPDDEIVAHQGYKSGGGPCYGMPEEPGWYQINGFINGTSFSGDHVELEIPSHYFYVCECDSEREAYEQLGAPPGQENPYADGSSGSDSTPTATPTPESGDGSSGSGSASTPGATPTPTATPTPSPTPTATPTSASDGGGDSSSGDSSDSGSGGDGGSDDGEGSGGAAGQTATASATVSGGSSGGQAGSQQVQQNQQGDAPATPTAGSGPGFGLVAALGGVVGAALLARRRD